MEYRRLGQSGLKLSLLSFGTWVTFAGQLDLAGAMDCLVVAREGGINSFDTAEVYGRGRAEAMLGTALQRLGWERGSFVISTKLYWGLQDCVNMRRTLNRKYLLQAIDGSLERLQTAFVDILFCHRPDPDTPIEETVWAMSDIIASGKAHYWGTSEWSPSMVLSAWRIADRYGLRKPACEQAEYNLFARARVEREYRQLFDELGFGLSTWSPLASGLLSGKYLGGVPERSRARLPGYSWPHRPVLDEDRRQRVAALGEIARQLDITCAQLAIAWCARNRDVTTVITGASSSTQLRENLRAVAVAGELSPAVVEELERIFP